MTIGLEVEWNEVFTFHAAGRAAPRRRPGPVIAIGADGSDKSTLRGLRGRRNPSGKQPVRRRIP
jgi:hypothetical protein